jgi:hypothetical protein
MSLMTQSDDELKIVDPKDVMRRLEGTIFWAHRFSPAEAVAHLVQECLLGGAAAVAVRHEADWWLVGADIDWLAGDADAAFQRVVSYPEAGPNSMRYEIALTAFADDVLTALDGSIVWVQGERESFPFSADDLRRLGRRVVVFRSKI